MLLDLTDDQEFFRETTARFLDEQVPTAELRRRRDDPAGFDPSYWQRGADLGWTSLLVGEEDGGGTISGHGVIDLTLVAYEFGRHGAPGPLVPTNIVAAALGTAGGEAQASVLADLLSGASIATWCYEEPGRRPLGEVSLDIRVDGDHIVLDGVKRPVESAAQAHHLLVTGRTDGGLTQALVPASAPGVSVTPLRTVDLTRRFCSVRFDGVRLPIEAVIGEVGGAAGEAERQLELAVALHCAETVGAMQQGFDMTVDWAFDRYSFGRPLASYQALKHRFADMKTWLEAGHAVSDGAAAAADARTADAGELASAAKAFLGDYGTELLQDCVQLHGGIGLTFEHDLHVFLRRVTLNRVLFGTPGDHRQRLARHVELREAVA